MTFFQVPAEIVMTKPCEQNRWYWCWAICQPDAHWGEWCSGKAVDFKKADEDAKRALSLVHAQQEL